MNRHLVSLLFVLTFLLIGIVQADYDDARINQASHFGGDALYCSTDLGCWMLDQNGNQLWDLPQSTIDALFETACETGMSEFRDVGVGTYGMMTIHISCYEGLPPTLELYGYDEHGKQNVVSFAPDYQPVGQTIPETVVATETPTTIAIFIIDLPGAGVTPVPTDTPEPPPS